MTFQQFLDAYNGKRNVGNTTENKGECVGLSMVWVSELGLPHIWGHAKDLLANADEKFFEKILNTPKVIPQEGDIVVWGKNFNGTFGHTGIATGVGDINTFECFEQNDPVGSNCHIKTYKYIHVIGWLRPAQISNQQALIDQLRQTRDSHWNDLVKIKDALGVTGEYSITTMLSRAEQLFDYEVQVGKKDEEITRLKQEATSVQSQLKEALQVNTEAQKIMGEHTQVIAVLQDEVEKQKRSLENSENIIRQLGDKIEQLKQSQPIEAYTPIQLVVTGILRMFKRG